MARIVYTDISGQERSVPFGADHPVVTIGRATDCTIRSNRKSVSRRHAEFRFNNGQYEVIDLNSSNGTYLIIEDERKPVMGREFLAPSDEVWCGDFILHFVQDDEDDVPTHAGGGIPNDPYAQPSSMDPYGGNQGYNSDPYGGSGGNGAAFNSDPYNSAPADPYSQPAEPYSQPAEPYGQPAEPFGQPQSSEPYGGSAGGGFDANPYADSPQTVNQNSKQTVSAGPSGAQYDPGLGEQSNSAWGATEPPSLEDLGRADSTREDSGDLERLMAEKQSIADLASRQAGELDELQTRLDDERRNVEELRNEVEALTQAAASAAAGDPAAEQALRDESNRYREELEAVRDEKRRLEERLHTALQSSERAEEFESDLRATTKRNMQLESELDAALTRASELESQLGDGAAAMETSERQREDLLAKERDIEALEAEVERLQNEVDDARKSARDAQQAASDGAQAIEEREALTRELDRHKRLVEEFERRNRELQSSTDDVDAQLETYRATMSEQEAKLDDLESEIAANRDEIDTLRSERDGLAEELESIGNVDDFRSEIEGLKQRLRLEKDKNKGDQHLEKENEDLKSENTTLEARVEELEGEIEVLRSQVSDESAPPPGSAVSGLEPDVLTEMRERVDMLERIVDAIERANLDALSTVDRVRLQSAIRDTEPKKSLDTLKSLLTDDD